MKIIQTKSQKNPGTPGAWALSFFRVKITVKNTLGPGTGGVPGFFF